jgi:hypothetical protein
MVRSHVSFGIAEVQIAINDLIEIPSCTEAAVGGQGISAVPRLRTAFKSAELPSAADC